MLGMTKRRVDAKSFDFFRGKWYNVAMEDHDVIIIGGGPAGVSAAVYAARGGLDVVLLHGGVSALHKAERIENYYGTGAVSGAALYDSGIAQAASMGVTVVKTQATFASYDGEAFRGATTDGEYTAKRLVIATGAARRTANVAGIREYEGSGVSYCAVCDAFFYRKKKVAVLGAGEYARHELETLARVAEETVLLTNGEKPSFDAPRIVEKKLRRVVGSEESGRVCSVEFEDGSTENVDGLFVALGVLGSGGIAKSMGVITGADGSIAVDARGMTNVDGLYAAGDCVSGFKQVAKAVSDGLTVGMSLISDIKGKRKNG